MADIESAYLERDQMQSTSLREEYLQVRVSLCNVILWSCFHGKILHPCIPTKVSVFEDSFQRQVFVRSHVY